MRGVMQALVMVMQALVMVMPALMDHNEAFNGILSHPSAEHKHF